VLKPSLDVEKVLRKMVKDAASSFEKAAKATLPACVTLSYAFEKVREAPTLLLATCPTNT